MRDGFIQAEYIQLTGAEYINTYYNANGKTRIILDCMQLDISATFCFYCGARTAVSPTNSTSNTLFFVNNAYRKDFYGTSKTTSGCYSVNTRFVIDNNMGVVTIGPNYTLSMTSSSTTSSGPLLLGASYVYSNSAITNLDNYAKLKIYSCKIYDNGTLVRDFVPCLEDNEDGHIGLYDKVNDVFYRPFGTGNPILNISNSINGNIKTSGGFKPITDGYVNIDGSYKKILESYIFKKNEYTQLNYIESNSIQKIDTGIKPSDDLITTIDFQCLSNGITENAIFGASWSINGYFLEVYKSGGSIIRWHYGGVNKDVTADATIRHTCSCSKSGITLDGTSYTFTPTGNNGTNNIYIFTTPDVASIRGPEATYNGCFKLYSLKMVKGGTTIRNYIPVKRNSDDMVGLYETIENKFYCSDTSIKDKIPYSKRSFIETTYSDSDYNTNAKWVYNNTNNYAGNAKVFMNSDGIISGEAYIQTNHGASDAIFFSKYGYDYGYSEPFNNLKTTNFSLVSITITNSSGVSLGTTNSSASVDDKQILHFSTNASALLSALPANYTLTVNVSRNSIACRFEIPITKVALEGRYFGSDDINSYFELSSTDFVQSGHYYASGLDLSTADGSANYIMPKHLIPIAYCNESGVSNVITVETSSAAKFGSDSGFIWYDARGSFLSGNVATSISADGLTMTNTVPTNAKYFSFNINNTNGITPAAVTSTIRVYTLSKNNNVYVPSISLSSVNYTSLVKMCDIRTITCKSFTAQSLVPTWTITSKVSGASYGFNHTSDGYYTSTNAGVNSSASVCRVNFTNNTGAAYNVKFNCINYAESNYDYGIIGKINTALSTSSTSDSTYTKSFKGSSSSSVQTVTLSIPTGTSWVDVKYRKDSSVDKNNDSLKFKITT